MSRHEQPAATRTPRLILFSAFILAASVLPVTANSIRGGRLYDEYWTAKGSSEPTGIGKHPLYPATGIQLDSETFRCKECHGWDYKGAAGAYGQGPHFTGIRGVFGTTKSAADIFALIKNPPSTTPNGHGYGALGLTTIDINDVVEFLQMRVIDTNVYIDAAKHFRGDAAQGQVGYTTTARCASCHGADGTAINPTGDPNDPEYLGTDAEDDPWQLLHKIRFSQPGETPSMPAWLGISGSTDQGAADIGRYIQDGNFPTGRPADPCQGGAAACNDGNPCTTDSCDPVAGCQHGSVADGASCADGNRCNGDETCQNDECVAGTPPTCNDGNPCTTDSCNPGTGCQNVALPNGSPCADATVCNGAETCQGGLCTAGTPLDCNDGNPCTTDACDALGGCQHVAVANGTSCADATVCNGAETCQSGVCTAGGPLDCDDANPCTIDSCNALAGCQHSAVVNGTSCADATVCNGAETCQSGACTAGSPLDCDDGNPCTTDACDAHGGCQHSAVANGTSCADATVCNGAETCQSGVCTAGSPLDCNDGKACTVDSCNAVAGCIHTPTHSCQPCSVPADCNDRNPCTTDTCQAGVCQNSAVPDGTSCADSNVCNGQETCQAGVCTAGTIFDCNDGNPCTFDTCNAISGCQHAAVTNGTDCGDGNLCNGAETCQSGSCTAGEPLACDDGNPCTSDACDPAVGCRNTALPDGSPCADATRCNGDETCQSGACTAGSPLACDDGNPCTTDSCSALGGCEHVAVADGTSCADATVCNGAETCQRGVCTAGTPLDCDDANPCTTDACNAISGCHRIAVPNGTSCADADRCNGDEACQAGICTAGNALGCDDGNACTADICDPARGCQHLPADAMAGAATTALNCDDGDACTIDGCNPTTGCTHEKVAGAAGVLCKLEQGLGTAPCPGTLTPSGISRPIDRAKARIRQAMQVQSSGGSRKSLVKAGKELGKARSRVARAAKTRKLGGPCADALKGVLDQVRKAIADYVTPPRGSGHAVARGPGR